MVYNGGRDIWKRNARMSGIREGEQKVIMAKRKVDIDLDYKGLEQCLEGIGRDFQVEGYGM